VEADPWGGLTVQRLFFADGLWIATNGFGGLATSPDPEPLGPGDFWTARIGTREYDAVA
jgi:hypothetical protein